MTNSATTGFHSAFTVFQSEMCILKDCSGAFNAKVRGCSGCFRIYHIFYFLFFCSNFYYNTTLLLLNLLLKSLLLEGNHRLSATEQFLHHMTRNIMVRALILYLLENLVIYVVRFQKIPIKIKVIVVPPSDDASLERTLTDDAKVSNKLPPYSRACCRLSTEMDRTEVENTKNEKRTFWETVSYFVTNNSHTVFHVYACIFF